MKNSVRCIFIGLCVWSCCGWASASNQEAVDTVAFCFAQGESIKGNIIASAFSDFLRKDSLKILGKSTDTVSYKVAYKDFRIEFTGSGVSGGAVSLDNIRSEQTIGTVTGDLKKQYIQCTVSYNRNIHFEFGENYLNDRSETTIQGVDLLGEGKNPDFNLNSGRKWHTVLCIEKSLSPDETFTIEGDTCLGNSVELRVPERYTDMSCQWSGGADISIMDEEAHEISVKTRGMSSLTTFVECTVSGCNDIAVSSSIRLRMKYTPGSELTFDDCLPTASKSITVKASNPMPDVHYEWVGLSVFKVLSTGSGSETIGYPVPGADNFTIRLNTTGGCRPYRQDAVVHRKLGSDVKLSVLDSCLAAGIPFHMATEPQLPNMDLTWSAPAGYHIFDAVGSEVRKDRVTVTRNTSMFGQTGLIMVSDKDCKGSTSEYVSISESYTEMVVKTEQGVILQDGDNVPPGVKIIFTAPQHSSITSGYSWYTSVEGGLSKLWNGPAEITVTAPVKDYSITVSVSYTSCFGKQSRKYTLTSNE
ncbi:MAG: hypothetical protein K2O66_07145 [Bacteroidales bacterium]|nr:hypothetical protein [Bacteroidales bacterium]MDE7073118.1 hypothetical protein [Bacteroidales bacterium]